MSTIKPITLFNDLIALSRESRKRKKEKVSEKATKSALEVFTWDNGTIDANEVASVKRVSNRLVKQLSAAAQRTLLSWIQEHSASVSAKGKGVRRAEAFRSLLSFALHREESPEGPLLTAKEMKSALSLLGTHPSPARIQEVQGLLPQLLQRSTGKQVSTVLYEWLKKHTLTPAPFQKELFPIIEGLLWPSESDRNIQGFSLGVQKNLPFPLTSGTLRSLLREENFTHIEERSFSDTFRRLSTATTENPLQEQEAAKKFGALYNVLSSSLTSVQLFTVGAVDKDLYVIGKAKDGSVAGIVTSVVET